MNDMKRCFNSNGGSYDSRVYISLYSVPFPIQDHLAGSGSPQTELGYRMGDEALEARRSNSSGIQMCETSHPSVPTPLSSFAGEVPNDSWPWPSGLHHPGPRGTNKKSAGSGS